MIPAITIMVNGESPVGISITLVENKIALSQVCIVRLQALLMNIEPPEIEPK